jgi:hypothetical protein
MTFHGAQRGGMGFVGGTERGQERLEVLDAQGDRFLLLHDPLGRSNGPGEDEFGQVDVCVAGPLVKQLSGTLVAAKMSALSCATKTYAWRLGIVW